MDTGSVTPASKGMHMKQRAIGFMLFVTIFIVACAAPAPSRTPPSAISSPAITQTASATAAETNEATSLARFSATFYAGRTATAAAWQSQTPTAISEFTATPAPAGPPIDASQPVLVFTTSGEYGYELLMVGADGTGLQKIVDDSIGQFVVRPGGSLKHGAQIAYMAYATQGDSDSPYVLKLVSLPQRTVQTLTAIDLPTHPVNDVPTAYEFHGGMVWSHNGKQIAFAGASATQMNVYVYSVETGQVTQVTHTANLIAQLDWSPDDRYITYQDFPGFFADGLGASSVWSVRADGSEPPKQLVPEDFNWGQGWNGDHTLIMQRIPYKSGVDTSILVIDAATGETQVVGDPAHDWHAEYFPDIRTVLAPRWFDTHSPHPEQWVLEPLDGGERVIPYPVGLNVVQWVPPLRSFVVNVDGPDDFFMALNGAKTPFSAPDDGMIPMPSDDGTWWVWHNPDGAFGHCAGIWISDSHLHYRKISDGATRNITWVPGVDRLIYLSDNALFVAPEPDFKPVQIGSGWDRTDEHLWDAVWIQ